MHKDLKTIKAKYPFAFSAYRNSKYDATQLTEFFDEFGLYASIHPEFYKEGINWNLQVFWYIPRSDWPTKPRKQMGMYITAGTFMYGDNNEFPTRKIAEWAGHVLCFELLERRLQGKKLLPEFFIDKETLDFHKVFSSIAKECDDVVERSETTGTDRS